MGARNIIIGILLLVTSALSAQIPPFFNPVTTLPAAGGAPAPDSVSREIAWWKFENTTADSSGNGNHLTALNSAGFTTLHVKEGSYAGNVNNLSGNKFTYDAIDVGDRFTISIWFYLTNPWPSSIRVLMAMENDVTDAGWVLTLDGYNNWIRFYTDDGSTAVWARGGFANTNEDAWHHAVVSVNKTAGVAKIYADNVNITSDSTIHTTFDTNTAGTVGNQDSYLGGQLWGYPDDARIIEDTCSADDVDFLFNHVGESLKKPVI